MNRKLVQCLLWISLLLLLSPCISYAEEITNEKKWEFELTPMYVWMINIDGKTSALGSSGSSTMHFNKVSDDMEQMYTSHFEARTEDYGFIVDYSYLELEGSEDTLLGKVKLTSEQSALEVLGFISQKVLADSRIDYLGGLRYNHMGISLSLNNTYSRDLEYIDPVVGLRWVTQINDKSRISVQGDAGGFGLGSEYTVVGSIMYDYNPWEHFGFKLGFKAMKTRYTQSKHEFKTESTTYGPLVGFNVIW